LNLALMKEIFWCISATYSVGLMTSMDFIPGGAGHDLGIEGRSQTCWGGAETVRVFQFP
jgi:hypothetical protein